MTADISYRGAGRSVVTYRFGGRDYPMKTVTNCKVCTSPQRLEIEEQIVAGRTYQKIVDYLPGDCDINLRNVGDHYRNGHMPLELSSTRQIVEQRARKVGRRIEQGEQSLVDGVSLLEVVVQRTFERIASGEMDPDIREGLRAAKMLGDLGEYDANEVDQQAYVEAFTVYHDEAARIMGEEAFEKFGDALMRNPVLKALAQRYEQQGEGDHVEGDVVESGEVSG